MSAAGLIAAEEAIVAAHGTAEMKGELVTEEEAAQDDDEEMGEGEQDDVDDIACLVCKGLHNEGDDQMLLCDGLSCENAYHQKCLSPPLNAVPEGDWLCPSCVESGNQVDHTKNNPSSMDVDEEEPPLVTEAEGYTLQMSSRGKANYYGVVQEIW